MEKDEYRIMFELEQTYWWFVGKQFLLARTLPGLIGGGGKGIRGLDIGCGTGINMRILERFCRPFGLEYSREAVSFLKRRRIRLLARADVNHPIPFKSDSFSVVTCLDVLEHLEDDRSLLREMARVCRPGGYILITVPAFRLLWSSHDEALHHKRRYSRRRLLEKTWGMRCEVIRSTYFNAALFLPILIVRKMRGLPRCGAAARSDFHLSLPGCLNRMLRHLYILELHLLEIFNFPFGVSLMLICRKRHPEER
ncbi:MAG: class I SAM-dependent methyltransferase [Deltaproteobacteria bacterium]|nr:class I SAM-dependent methyltransferase [Deltaproteobacteria bacterium]